MKLGQNVSRELGEKTSVAEGRNDARWFRVADHLQQIADRLLGRRCEEAKVNDFEKHELQR